MTKQKSGGGIRTAKACEQCRRRRIKCDGNDPCSSCLLHHTECAYRSQIRRSRRKALETTLSSDTSGVRNPASSTVSPIGGAAPTLGGVTDVSNDDTPYASQRQEDTGKLEIFCGPSSTFALIQDLYRRLRTSGKLNHLSHEPMSHEHGLDTFQQRELYFGNTSNLPSHDHRNTDFEREWCTLGLAAAQDFFETFFTTWHHLTPVLRQDNISAELVQLWHARPISPDRTTSGQAVVFLVVALGALASGELAWAEILYLEAKGSSKILDETTSGESVATALLAALFQISLGRGTASYICLGVAARKAFAMGYHRNLKTSPDAEEMTSVSLPKRSAIWAIFVYDCFISMSFGKKRAVSASDIQCPPPAEHQVLCEMAEICRKLEECEESIYNHRHASLRSLWESAQKLLTSLQGLAKELKLGPYATGEDRGAGHSLRTAMTHALYYHTIASTLQPFAIASGKDMSGVGFSGTPTTNSIWLREAHRQALAAAEDQILLLSQRIPQVKQIRFLGFFLESSTMLLLHDTYRDPTHYSSNVQNIKKALDCLSQLVQGEPVTSAAASIKHILLIVERAIGVNQEHTLATEDATMDELADVQLGDLTYWSSQFGLSWDDAQPWLYTDPMGSWNQWLFESDDVV